MTLEDRLERLANRKPPGDPAEVLAAARARAESRPDARSPRFLAAAAVVAVLALAAGGLALAGGDDTDSVTVAGPDGDEGTDNPVTSGPPSPPGDAGPGRSAAAETLVRLDVAPQDLQVVGDDVWVAASDLIRFSNSGDLPEEVDPIVGLEDVGVTHLALAEDGSLWGMAGVSTDEDPQAGFVVRVDPETSTVLTSKRIFTARNDLLVDLSAGGAGVWATDGASLLRLDTAGDDVQQIAVPGAYDLIVGEDSVWVAGDGRVHRVVPDTGELRWTVGVTNSLGGIPMVEAGGLLRAASDDEVIAFDEDGRTVERHTLPHVLNLAAAGKDLWAVTATGLYRITAAGPQLVATFERTFGELAVTSDRAWVGDTERSHIRVLDLAGAQGGEVTTTTEPPKTTIAVPEAAGEVAVYFLSAGADMSQAGGYERVLRDAGDGASVEDRARLAVSALAEGPNPEERKRGLTSPFSVAAGTIRDVTFNDGTLVVDFEEGLTSAVNLQRDHWGPELLGPLRRTVFEISEVRSLELWGEGSCATFVSWANFDLQGDEPPECVARSREQAEDW